MILSPTSENISKAAKLLQSGQTVSFPTETVYGLGANALDSSAVQKIFALKNRPATNPLIVHVASVQQAFELIDPRTDKKIIDRFRKVSSFWPGPLSLIVPKINEISELVSAGGKTIAIRIPKHPVALELLRACNLPIAAPSANKSFAISPTSAEHVHESFGLASLMILDGGFCQVGLESTVLDISAGFPAIMRPGAITLEKLMQALEENCLPLGHQTGGTHSGPLKSPGLFGRHYAPKTPLIFIDELVAGPLPKNLGVILFGPELKDKYSDMASNLVFLSESGKLEEVATNLYNAIRNFDRLGFDLIAIQSCREEGIGAAIMDRLRRARHLPEVS